MGKLQLPILPSRLFRFRSLTGRPNALEEEIEAVCKQYLWCAQFKCLNDPMEGFYNSTTNLRANQSYQAIVDNIRYSKTDIGIASFSELNDDVLMWTHYASNHSGICVCYSSKKLLNALPEDARVVRLAYRKGPPRISDIEAQDIKKAVRKVLSQKADNWAYEREWRVLSSLNAVPLVGEQPVKSIYLGAKIEPIVRDRIHEAIQSTGIKLYAARVFGYKHKFEPQNEAACAAKEKRRLRALSTLQGPAA